jgi:hypothetical protein
MTDEEFLKNIINVLKNSNVKKNQNQNTKNNINKSFVIKKKDALIITPNIFSKL